MLRLTLFGRFRAEDEGGREIPIKSRKAKALLAFLALPAGKERSREAVMALLWSNRGEEQARASLRQALSGLRRELGPGDAGALCVGADSLKLDPDHVVVEPAAQGERLLDGLQVHDPAFEEWLRDERLRHEEGAVPTGASAKVNSSGKPSILVLPFKSLSADAEQQYFSDGITDDIMTELSRFGSLDVVARQSAFVLRDRAQDVGKTLADLGADYSLEGSVRKAGTRIRLTAQLVDLGTGKQIWADRYDRELADVFVIQDELVQAIVAKLVGRLEIDSHARALRKLPENLAAYDYYLQGLWHDRKYDAENARAAVAVLKKAIALDPTFARAYGLLAHSLIVLGFFGEREEAASDEILELAKKAVELDPTDSDCFAKLGIAHVYRLEHEQARKNLETAQRMNPNDSYTYSHYAWYLETVGEAKMALENLDRALALDPHPPQWHWDLRCETLYALHRYEEAAEILEQKSLAHFWDFGYLAACYGQLGKNEKARECWEKTRSLFPEVKLAMIGNTIGYLHQADADHWTEGLLKAGLSD
jgi:TolB-like protein/Tfp pilus assembly protein PilF